MKRYLLGIAIAALSAIGLAQAAYVPSTGLVLISTQTAAASASLQWTGLGTTYQNYKLLCHIILATNNQSLLVQVGEGGGPTWQTTGYQTAYITGSANTGTIDGGNKSGFFHAAGGANSGNYLAIDSMIFGIPSTSASQQLDYKGLMKYKAVNTGGTFAVEMVSGEFAADSTAKTGVRVISSSGNITAGTCSLYGIVD